MTGSGSTGVNESMVNKIKQVLMDAKVDVDKLHVEKPAAGTMGGSGSADSLNGLVNAATERITSALSETSDALIHFVDALDSAMRAVKDADHDAEVAFNSKVGLAVDGIKQPFFDNLMKDDRPDMPGIQIPFLPLTPDQLQEIASRSEFGRDGQK